MSKIKVLSENLANQIAAGEVVERPASVVKELVENAIDAGASRLAIEVEGGGTRLIRVIDDGEGMDQDDVLLCLERHATSKLSTVEELNAIRSLGFRGEAIPSIASVSKLTITSRPAAAHLGCRAEVQFGRLVRVHEMGCGAGTVMEVANLFGNVPARKKFLKTAQTELAHLAEVVKCYALARPELAFTYAVEGRVVFELAAAGSDGPETRMRAVFGLGEKDELVSVASDADTASGLKLNGYLLPPEQAGPGGRLRLFVNGRTVRDRMLAHAVAEGMQGFLMKGRQPAGVLFVELDPAEVDVNVHPAKQEVKFRRSNVVHDRIVAAVRQGLHGFQQQLRKELFVRPAAAAPVARPAIDPAAKDVEWQAPLPLARQVAEPAPAVAVHPGVPPPSQPPPQPIAPEAVPPPAVARREPVAPPAPTPPLAQAATVAPPVREGPAPVLKSEQDPQPVRVIGQLMDSYILCEGEDGLLVIDQHAAHERILYERLQEQYRTATLTKQMLLFPVTLEFGPLETGLIEQHGDELARMGLDLAEFGGGTYVVKGVPAILAHLPAADIVGGLLDQFATLDDGGSGQPGRIEQLLATMACKAAIKANHAMEPREVEELLKKMAESPAFSHCPHGRPVVKRFSEYDIKKWFRRI